METRNGDVVKTNSSSSSVSLPETDKQRKAREAAERRAAIKARKEFRDALDAAKGDWERGDAQNISDYSAGLKSWSQYLLDKHNLEVGYYEDREKVYREYNLMEDEDYQELLKKKEEMMAAWLGRNAAMQVEESRRRQEAEETQTQMDFYTPGSALYGNEEALQQNIFEIRMKYLKKMQAAYKKTSKEWHGYQVRIQQEEGEEQLRRQKLLAGRVAAWKKKYEYLAAAERYALELELLKEAYGKNLVSYEEYLRIQRELRKKYADEYMPESAKPSADSAGKREKKKQEELGQMDSLYDQGLVDKEQYEQAKDRIEKKYQKKSFEVARKFGSEQVNQLLDIYEAWQDFFGKTEEDGGNWATKLAALASSVFAVMNAGMQQASELVQAELELQTVKIEKRYDVEIDRAEGNSFRVKKLEKQKEKELAKIKNEANRKMFAMQMIQAVAQTATNAINAYGSAAAIPLIGHIMAPIAAAMAVAAGMMQIATIRKQQQASEAQGYSKGGFTPDGDKDKPAGVVHAGEWVASQKLTKSPRVRPLLEALDYAQRNNTIGSIRADDVSRSIAAPMMLAAAAAGRATECRGQCAGGRHGQSETGAHHLAPGRSPRTAVRHGKHRDGRPRHAAGAGGI